MKESAEIAYRSVTADFADFGPEAGAMDPGFPDQTFVHLHVPEEATSKDGPSAGASMATALLSLARGLAIGLGSGYVGELAMTGELTLPGRVLPVGGIREKVIAAKRARISELILPDANRRDFDELPAHVRDGLTVHCMADCPEVGRLVFG